MEPLGLLGNIGISAESSCREFLGDASTPRVLCRCIRDCFRVRLSVSGVRREFVEPVGVVEVFCFAVIFILLFLSGNPFRTCG